MIVIFSAFLLIFSAMVISPFTLPRGTVNHLDGSIGEIDHWNDLEDLPWPQRAIYILGDVNCHQRSDRSLFLNDNQMPFCARDVGLLVGAMVGLGSLTMIGRRPHWTFLMALLTPMAVDGLLQAITGYESNNEMRLLTGALAGISVGFIIGWSIQRYYHGSEPRKDPT